MRRWGPLIVLFLVPLTAVYARQSASLWRDSSPHRVRFVTVEQNVRLEVLDWGGSGEPIIFLAGGGNTAHVFDEFAAKFTDIHHVYGVTRRGFGVSGFSTSETGIDRLRDDLIQVMDTLQITKPVLVGHSIAGAELSRMAASHPDRVAGLIYLEAAYPYAFAGDEGPSMKDFQNIRGPQPPAPGASDLVSFTALQEWNVQIDGFRIPEAEFRQIWDSSPEGHPIKPRNFPGSQVFMTILTGNQRYTHIPVPALVIFAIPHVPESWIARSTSSAVQEAARAYFTRIDDLAEKQAKVFEAGVAAARIVRMKGSHYIFLSNEADVLGEMRSFLGGLK
jgi:pimeloyl-ACP methyl ester carboxylesterase